MFVIRSAITSSRRASIPRSRCLRRYSDTDGGIDAASNNTAAIAQIIGRRHTGISTGTLARSFFAKSAGAASRRKAPRNSPSKSSGITPPAPSLTAPASKSTTCANGSSPY